MTRTFVVALIAHCSLLIALLAACGGNPPPVPARPSPTPTLSHPTAAGERTVTDMAGRTISVPAPVDKVVAISPSALEFATALGLAVLGRPSDTNPVAGSPATVTVGTTINPDFNAIAALKPDLVIADAAYHGSRLRDFEKFPFPVFILKAASYSDVLTALDALGTATGHTERATTLRIAIETKAASIASRVAGQRPPTVLILTGSGREVFGGSDSTYLGSLVQKLGAKNVLGGDPQGAPIAGFGLVDIGQAASKNPDVVLTLPSGAGGLAEQVKTSASWANNTAVKQNRVVDLDTALFLRSPGPRVGEALEQLAAILYPQAR